MEFYKIRSRIKYNLKHYQSEENPNYTVKNLPYGKYLNRLLTKARQFTKDTDIDQEFLVNSFRSCDERCILTGIPFEYNNRFETYTNPYAPSLDQIIPSKGYYKNNVQLISNIANRAKNDMLNEDFIEFLGRLAKGDLFNGSLVYPVFTKRSPM